MTVLTLTPDPGTASVRLTLTGAPAGPVTIARVDANGARPVRLLAGQEPIAGDLTVTDYEPALAGDLIRYDVKDGAGVTVSASTTLAGVTRPQLQLAALPQYRLALDLVTGYGADRAGTTTVHDVIGRTDPVVTLGRLGTRRGTLTLWAADHGAARAVEQLADRSNVLLLRQGDHSGMDLYFVATRTGVTPDDEATSPRRWSVELDYVEVAAPTGNLLGALGWTFEDVATLGSFAALPATFATFTDLTVGTP